MAAATRSCEFEGEGRAAARTRTTFSFSSSSPVVVVVVSYLWSVLIERCPSVCPVLHAS